MGKPDEHQTVDRRDPSVSHEIPRSRLHTLAVSVGRDAVAKVGFCLDGGLSYASVSGVVCNTPGETASVVDRCAASANGWGRGPGSILSGVGCILS